MARDSKSKSRMKDDGGHSHGRPTSGFGTASSVHWGLGPIPPTPKPLPDPFPDPLELIEEYGKPQEFIPNLEHYRYCKNRELLAGCYKVTVTPRFGFVRFDGTLRVEDTNNGPIISGDLYRFVNLVSLAELLRGLREERGFRLARAETMIERYGGRLGATRIQPSIPIYARDKYFSYLLATELRRPPLLSRGKCTFRLTMDEYQYRHPTNGTFSGSFPTNPSRTLTAYLSVEPSDTGPKLGGTLYVGGVELGAITLNWVSEYFRRATLEIDVVQGAVAPQPVPDPTGTTTEDFATIFATAGWDLTVDYNQQNIAVPATVANANACWANGELHNLMTNVRASSNLDREWRAHLLVVPGAMNCGRGIMYDQTGAHREGAVSYSDDGYPNTAQFGAAAGATQRNQPRAFLRSAAHEVGHVFNMQHQSRIGVGEPGSDNSIMTTTPGVAQVIANAGGNFPNNIQLGFNQHTRHHLIHFPDPVVRPGGMNWKEGHDTTVPEADADRLFLGPEDLDMRLHLRSRRIKLGEPLVLEWEITNKSREPIHVPSDLSPPAQHARISATGPSGVQRRMTSFVISTDTVSLVELKPGKSLRGSTNLFWSSNGFAFAQPGGHAIEVAVLWNDSGLSFGTRASVDVWVDYPANEAECEIAATLLHDEVGMAVALGGSCGHLKEAVTRIDEALRRHPDHPGCKCIAEITPQAVGARETETPEVEVEPKSHTTTPRPRSPRHRAAGRSRR